MSIFGLGSSTVSGQHYSEGNMIGSVGYGFGNLAQATFSVYKNSTGYNYSAIGPVFLKGEYMITDNFGIGGAFAYAGAEVIWEDEFTTTTTGETLKYKVDWSSWSLLARANYHLGDHDKFDPYLGAGVGYRTAKWNWSDNDPDEDYALSYDSPFHLGMELTGGARYFFTENIGAYVEVGMAKAVVQFGISAKM